MHAIGGPSTLRAVTADAALTERGADGRGPMIAPVLARTIIAIVFCGFGAVALVIVLDQVRSTGEIVLAVGSLLALLVLQFFYFCRPSTDLRSPMAYGMLAVQAALVYLPFFVLGQGWVSQPSFLAGSMLLVLGPRVGWAAFAAVVVSTGVEQYVVTGGLWEIGYIAVNAATTGLYVYGLTRLARLVVALHDARDELATRSVTDERVRFAHDLHTLLGSSLSAIAPRGELVLRLLRRRPEQAGRELLEIVAITRRALADLRSIARLYRETFLDDETASLTAMLAASDVELRVDLDSRELSPEARRRLAAVLRDGIATVLRRREPAHCEIVLQQQSRSVTVDIRTDAFDVGPGAGGHFAELATTVDAMMGELTTGSDPDGRLHLRVTLPATGRPAVHRSAADPAESVPLLATTVANGVALAALFGLYLQAQLRLFEVNHRLGVLALGTVCLIGALAVQVGWLRRPEARQATASTYLLLGLQAVLVYLPWLYNDQMWTGLQGFLAGSALLVLRPLWGWTVFAAVLASIVVVQLPDARSAGDDMLHLFLTLNLGLLVFGLTWMARSVRQLRAARQELAQAALAETRLRFAQDLHDMLGLSLSAITMKSELAHRLIGRDPARAATVVAEMVELSRRALADVRSMASGDPDLSLTHECRTAQALLTTAGLQVQMVLDGAELRPEIDTALATVLREGVTNVLRHSKGAHCEIRVCADEHDAHLIVVNDGATRPITPAHLGSGIRNMSDRVGALGGVLTSGYEGADGFRLHARVPRTGT